MRTKRSSRGQKFPMIGKDQCRGSQGSTDQNNVFQIPSWRHWKLPEPLGRKHHPLSPLPTHSPFPESS